MSGGDNAEMEDTQMEIGSFENQSEIKLKMWKMRRNGFTLFFKRETLVFFIL